MNESIKEDPKKIVELFYGEPGQNLMQYEVGHIRRFKETLGYLRSRGVSGRICDMGCGSGWIINQLAHFDDSNVCFGVDGFMKDDDPTAKFDFFQANLDYDDFSNDLPIKEIDHMLSFETFEHLANPYNFILECKKMMKVGAMFHITYPTINVQHNTFYPSLLWPKENFEQFMQQMAFELVDYDNHWKGVIQTSYGGVHVFTFKNLPWSEVKMKWPKAGAKFQGQPPHVQVNI